MIKFWTKLSRLSETARRQDMVVRVRYLRTDNFVFQCLITIDGLAVSSSFMFFTSKVLHCFVIEQTIGMDSSGDLCAGQYLRHPTKKRAYNVTLVHLASYFCTPLSKDDTCCD